MEWLPMATPLFHHQLYFMGRYCVQKFKLLRSINHKLWTISFDA